MSRGIIYLSAILLFWSYSFSQPTSKFFAELSIGTSIPVGKFAEKRFVLNDTTFSDVPGMAKSGGELAITTGFYLTQRVGVIVMISGATNKQDAKIIRRSLQERFPGYMVSVESKRWNTMNALGGVMLREKFPGNANKLSWHARILAGINKTSVPALSYTIANQFGGGAVARQDKRKLPVTFAFTAGAGLKYELNERWYVLLNSHYLHANPANSFTYTTNFPEPSSREVKQQYPVRMINITGGVGLHW